MAAPLSKELATAEVLVDRDRAEVIQGAIVQKASPTPEHSRAQAWLAHLLLRRFDRGPGGRWPGGWWLATEAETQYETSEIYLHDVAGWRRDRVAQAPSTRPFRIRPDWACELVSPSSGKRDRVDKLQVLHRNGVPHYWLADPVEQLLIVHRWQPQGYLIVLTAAAGQTVRAEPFDACELSVAAMFGSEPDED